MDKPDQVIKVILKSGLVINFLAKPETIYKLKNHYNFLEMHDEFNEVYVDLDSIAAFENLNTRKPAPEVAVPAIAENNGQQETETQA